MNHTGLVGRWLGCQPYTAVLQLQRSLVALRQAGSIGDVALFVEHQPVITLGRGAKAEHLLASAEHLAQAGIEVIAVERGGDVTLHAPGQLVCYPIIGLGAGRRDVRRFVMALCRSMNSVLEGLGLQGGTVEGLVGLWVDSRSPQAWPGADRSPFIAKIGAVGVRISRWVTMHGYALNLGVDLSLFNLIVPCGIREYPVTSVRQLTGAAPSPASLVPEAFRHLAQGLQLEAGELVDESEREPLAAQPATPMSRI